jgi:hypothetical protein
MAALTGAWDAALAGVEITHQLAQRTRIPKRFLIIHLRREIKTATLPSPNGGENT